MRAKCPLELSRRHAVGDGLGDLVDGQLQQVLRVAAEFPVGLLSRILERTYDAAVGVEDTTTQWHGAGAAAVEVEARTVAFVELNDLAFYDRRRGGNRTARRHASAA